MNSHGHNSFLTFAASLVLTFCVPTAQESVDLIAGCRVPEISQESVDLISGNRVPTIAEESVDLISGDRVPAIVDESVDLIAGEPASEESTDLISVVQIASVPAPQKATPAHDDDWPSPITELLF
jgi:hypothetical protein